jgi:hypothetical protein
VRELGYAEVAPPWEREPFVIDFASHDALESAATMLNALVADVECEDPWCKRVLGVSGLGEGLVLYPQGIADAERANQLMFKAKRDRHRTAGKRAVQLDATVAATS